MLLKRVLFVAVVLVLTLSSIESTRIARAADPVTIQYWNINTPTFGGPQVDTFIKSFQEKNPDIKVEARSFSGYSDVLQAAQAAIAAGNPPDVVQIGWLYRLYVGNNFPFVSVEDLVKKFGGQEHLKLFPQNVLDLPRFNGAQMGMAYSLSNSIVYFNADLFKQAGLDPAKPPVTFEDWAKAGQIFKDKLNLPIITFAYADDNWNAEAVMASNGGGLLTCANGKYKALVDAPESIEAVQTWADLNNKGYGLNLLTNDGRAAFLAGKVGAFSQTIAARAGLQKEASFDLRAARFPAFGSKPTKLPGGGNMLVIFSTDDAKQKAAWSFVQYLTTKEGFTEWTKGTGYVPLIPGLTEDAKYLADFVAQNPIEKVAVDQLPNVFSWTAFPGSNGLAAGQSLFEAMQSSLGGKKTAKDALTEAAGKINSLISSESCKAS